MKKQALFLSLTLIAPAFASEEAPSGKTIITPPSAETPVASTAPNPQATIEDLAKRIERRMDGDKPVTTREYVDLHGELRTAEKKFADFEKQQLMSKIRSYRYKLMRSRTISLLVSGGLLAYINWDYVKRLPLFDTPSASNDTVQPTNIHEENNERKSESNSTVKQLTNIDFGDNADHQQPLN